MQRLVEAKLRLYAFQKGGPLDEKLFRQAVRDLKTEISFDGKKAGIDKLIYALNNQERFIRLDDGTTGVIPQKWLSSLAGTAGFLAKNNGSLRAAKTQTEIIESLIGISEKSRTGRNKNSR